MFLNQIRYTLTNQYKLPLSKIHDLYDNQKRPTKQIKRKFNYVLLDNFIDVLNGL